MKIRRYIFQFTTDDKTMKLRERQRGGGRKGGRKRKKIGHEFSFGTAELLDINSNSITYWLSDLRQVNGLGNT